MSQYDTFRNPEKCQYLAKQIVKAKIQSQINFLELTKNPDVKEGIQIKKIRTVNRQFGNSVVQSTVLMKC